MSDRRQWLKQTAVAAIGLGINFRSLGNEEGLLRNFGREKGLINLGSNENPYGISPLARQAILDMIANANRYQYNVPSLQNFRKELADHFRVNRDQVLVTAGSGEGLALLARHFNRGNLVCANPTFGILPNVARRLGSEVIEVPLTVDKTHDLPGMLQVVDKNTSLIYVVNPANPSATMIKPGAMKEFCAEASKKAVVAVDEAYLEFLEAPDNESMTGMIEKHPNVLVVGTFSKIHGMAGLRVGYLIGHPTIIQQLEQSYFGSTQNCVSNLSMAAALASLKDEAHRKDSRKKNALARSYTYDELKKLGYNCHPSHTNFMFFQADKFPGDISQEMLKHGIIVRSNQYSDGKWCRASVGTIDEMKEFVSALKRIG